MDTRIAAQTMLKMMEESTVCWNGNIILVEEHAATYKHLVYMLKEIVGGHVTGEKSHRWLSWVQCACYYNGVGTLEELKLVNKNS